MQRHDVWHGDTLVPIVQINHRNKLTAGCKGDEIRVGHFCDATIRTMNLIRLERHGVIQLADIIDVHAGNVSAVLIMTRLPTSQRLRAC